MSRGTIFRRGFLVGAIVAGMGGACPAPARARGAPLKADRIVVIKSARRLDLLRDGELVRSYPVRLGQHPVGPKIFQDDGRTPEGHYVIDRRTQATAYHLALHISYPQPENVARAAKYHLPAGGAIFIHGTPGNGPGFEHDWTDGCIAVSNPAIEEIWTAVGDGTAIDLEP